ncbi:MAG: transposase [Pseudomonadota bacterium]
MSYAGWRSRGYLPHCDGARLVQHIVFGLSDALPARPAEPQTAQQRFIWSERELDKGHGSRALAEPQNASVIEDCLLHDDGHSYSLVAWCVMPTHVHVIVEQHDGQRLEDIVQTWKSVTSHRINRAQNRTGALWRREYFDRFMRTEEKFATTVAYVENNPVKAGLVEKSEDWRL